MIRVWYEQIFVSENIRISEYSSHPDVDPLYMHVSMISNSGQMGYRIYFKIRHNRH